jgi:nicotinamide N-methyltransferase
LCEHPELVRGKSCIELGAGIGIVGMVAAALGAERVVVTDMPEALPILERNAGATRSKLSACNRNCSVSAAPLPWGDASGIDAVGRGEFDVVLAADVLIAGWAHTHGALAETMLALLRPGRDSQVLIGYEYREEWETIGDFQDRVEALGFAVASEQLEEGPQLDDDFFLYTLKRTVKSLI